jgi:hypothetical protein
MAVNLDACIQCNRCVRACREEQVNDVIGYALRGADSKIVFDLDDPMATAPAWPAANACRPAPRARSAPRRTSARKRWTARSIRSARSAAWAASSPTTCATKNHQRGRPRRPGQPWPPVREGALWFRLRPPPRPPDGAADPQARRAQGGAPYGADWRIRVPRGHLGRGAGPGRRHAEVTCATRTAPRRWRALARPRAATKRPTCSRSWCAPALAATTWTTARGCAMPPAWPRCSKAWARAR